MGCSRPLRDTGGMSHWIIIGFVIWLVIAVVTTILRRPVYGPG